MIFNISKMVYQKQTQLLHYFQNMALKSFRNFPEKNSKLKFFQKCLKFSKNSLKFPKILKKLRLFFFIARVPFGEYPLISCSVDDSDEKSLICFAQQSVLLTLLQYISGLSPLLVGRKQLYRDEDKPCDGLGGLGAYGLGGLGAQSMTSPIVITYILIWIRFTNERHSTSIGTIGLPRLAR